MIRYDDYGDYSLTLYDYWIVWILLISKIGLQCHYSVGEEYNKYKEIELKEQVYEIEKYGTLRNKFPDLFGADVANLMFRYMAFFYEKYCPDQWRFELDENYEIEGYDTFNHEMNSKGLASIFNNANEYDAVEMDSD